MENNITTIKGYELHERIGSGGFGVVHRAFQTTVGREVAIKIILPHFANQPDFIRRFEAEAQIIARLEHLHIVPLYDFWRDPDGAYLVMRWMRGGSLRQALDQQPYDLTAAALLLDQIAAALAMAHHHAVVHRDLKPANILLDEDRNAYLSDFGIAKDIGKSDGSQIESGVILGSPNYLSPEQACSEPITPQSDIYSLGVMLYEVLTGQHPFPNLTPVERMYRHINDPLPVIEILPSEVVDNINAIIQKATAKNPAHRYDDVLAMAAEFRKIATPHMNQGGQSLVEQLTLREHEILGLIVAGCSNREIAQQLCITIGTVKWHVRQIYQKLRVRSRVQAIVRARELDLIVPDAESAPSLDVTYVPPPNPENPYKGLRAFQTADARDFFGREKLVQKLINRLAEKNKFARFLAVVGPSGSGKSSVVKAGLIPALWHGDLPGSDRWFIVEMVPGAYPLDELEIALSRIATDQVTNLREHLERDQRGLVRAASLILPDDDSELVIIVDQLEEIFTLVEADAARVHFLALLVHATTDPRSRVRVISTLRADFYDRPLHYPEFGELIRSRMETILPLSADELEAAITKPAERMGVTFEAGLVTHIVSDVHYQPGALPLLQYALTELFEQRSNRELKHADYQALGGAVGALAKRAEEIYGEQAEPGRETIQQMFMRLVVPGEETGDTRRRVTRSELLGIANDEDAMDEIIDTYASYRLLTLDHDLATRKSTVEVAHEAILQEWERLRAWLDESRHDIRQQRLLATATTEWEHASREPSYLLRGARLAQVKGWATGTKLALTPSERDYLQTSIHEDERQETLERNRQQRELETQRQLAKQERRSANRLRYLVTGLAAFLVVAVILTLLALNERNQAESARDSEQYARAQAEASSRRTDAQRLGLEALSAAQNGDEANLIALLAIQSLNTDYTPQGDAAIQTAMTQTYSLYTLQSESEAEALKLVLSPDDHYLAVSRRDNTVEIWDLTTRELSATFDGGEHIAFLPDGKRIVAATPSGTVIVWDMQTKKRQVVQDGLEGYARSIAISPEKELVILASQTGKVLFLDFNTWTQKAEFQAHTSGINGMVVSPDGRGVLATVSEDYMAYWWDIDTQTLLQSFDHDLDWIVSAAFTANGYGFATGTSSGAIRNWAIYDLDMPLNRFWGHDAAINAIEFSPDMRLLASGSDDTTLKIWDFSDVDESTSILRHASSVNDIEWSSDGKILYASSGNTVRAWNTEAMTMIPRYSSSPQRNHNAYSPDGSQLAIVGMEVMSVYDLSTNTYQEFISDVEKMHNGVRYTSDGQSLVFGSDCGEVYLWDVANWSLLRTYTGPEETVTIDVTVSPDNRYVVAGDMFGNLVVWDFETTEIVFLASNQGAVMSLSFSPDSQLLLQSSSDGMAHLWNTQTWEEIWNRPVAPGVNEISFSPDGRYFVIADSEPSLSLWDVATLTHIHNFVGHIKGVQTVAFGPNSNLILSGDEGSTARLWDVETGEELRRIVISSGNDVLIAPDGKTMLINDGSFSTIWPVEIAELKTFLCQQVTRDFTEEERQLYEITDQGPTCDQFME